MARDLLGVLDRYRRHTPGVEGPPGSRTVSARYQIHPVAGQPETRGPAVKAGPGPGEIVGLLIGGAVAGDRVCGWRRWPCPGSS